MTLNATVCFITSILKAPSAFLEMKMFQRADIKQ